MFGWLAQECRQVVTKQAKQGTGHSSGCDAAAAAALLCTVHTAHPDTY